MGVAFTFPRSCTRSAVRPSVHAPTGAGQWILREIAFCGDSITAGDAEQGYTESMVHAQARAMSGSLFDLVHDPENPENPSFASAGWRMTGENSIPTKVDDAIAAGAKCIVLHGGTNDVQNEIATQDILDAIEAQAVKCRAAGVKIVLTTLLGPSESISDATKKAAYGSANAGIREIATRLNLTLADYAQATGSGTPGETLDEYIGQSYGGDNLHPNVDGRATMGATLATALMPFLNAQLIEEFWTGIAAGKYGVELTDDYLFPSFTGSNPDGYGFTQASSTSSATLGQESATDGRGDWWTFDFTDATQADYNEFGSGIPAAGDRDTAQAGGASTITLAATASGSNSYKEANKNNWLWITGGTGAGQVRRITAYDGGTKVATVDAAWATVPDATSTYEIGFRAGERIITACEVVLDSGFDCKGIGLLARALSPIQNIGDLHSGGAAISKTYLSLPAQARPMVLRTPPIAVTDGDRFRTRLLIRGNGTGKVRRLGMWAMDRFENQLTFTP